MRARARGWPRRAALGSLSNRKMLPTREDAVVRTTEPLGFAPSRTGWLAAANAPLLGRLAPDWPADPTCAIVGDMKNGDSAGGRVLVRMPRGLHRDLVAMADGEGVSLNQFVVSILARAAGQAISDAAHGGEPAEQGVLEAVYRVADRVEGLAEQLATIHAQAGVVAARVDDVEDAWAERQKGFWDYAIEGATDYPLGTPAQHRRKAIQQAHLHAGQTRIADRVKERIATRIEAAEDE